jgi:hypothetical protein
MDSFVTDIAGTITSITIDVAYNGDTNILVGSTTGHVKTYNIRLWNDGDIILGNRQTILERAREQYLVEHDIDPNSPEAERIPPNRELFNQIAPKEDGFKLVIDNFHSFPTEVGAIRSLVIQSNRGSIEILVAGGLKDVSMYNLEGVLVNTIITEAPVVDMKKNRGLLVYAAGNSIGIVNLGFKKLNSMICKGTVADITSVVFDVTSSNYILAGNSVGEVLFFDRGSHNGEIDTSGRSGGGNSQDAQSSSGCKCKSWFIVSILNLRLPTYYNVCILR